MRIWHDFPPHEGTGNELSVTSGCPIESCWAGRYFRRCFSGIGLTSSSTLLRFSDNKNDKGVVA